MIRLKLFFFGLTMAVIGLFKPHKVLEIINTQEELRELRALKAKIYQSLGLRDDE